MSIQSMPSDVSLRHILILSLYLRLGIQGDPFPSGLSTKTLYAFIFLPDVSTILSSSCKETELLNQQEYNISDDSCNMCRPV
jgi:hypothetical protein